MSDLVTRDETTALALTLPEGWQSLSDTGLGVVGFDAVGRQRGDAFVDNVTAAVSARAQSSDLDTIVADATVLWLDAVDTAHVLQVLDLSGEFEGPDALQLVVGTYSTGIV